MNTPPTINRGEIVAAIVAAIKAAPVAKSAGYSYLHPSDVAPAVDDLARQIARSETSAALYRSDVLRDVFRRFDGKIINRRLWSAVRDACYAFQPAGDVLTNHRGEAVKPCAVHLDEGTRYGSPHFASVWYSGAYFGGETCDSLIYGRSADWRTCPDDQKTEYKLITGQRLDAARALAVLDYEATTETAHADELRAALDRGAVAVGEYLRAVVRLADVLDAIPHAFRDAFGLGFRRSLPVTVQN